MLALQVCREAGGRPDDDRAVHPVRAGAEGAAQSGGAELEHPGEPVGEVVDGGLVAGLGLREEVAELDPGLVVGVVVDPGLGGVDQLLGLLLVGRPVLAGESAPRPCRAAYVMVGVLSGGVSDGGDDGGEELARTARRRPGRPR